MNTNINRHVLTVALLVMAVMVWGSSSDDAGEVDENGQSAEAAEGAEAAKTVK